MRSSPMLSPSRHSGLIARHGRRQSGAALIVSLILLMVLTVLAVSTMRTASLGLLMAGNTQYRENAFQLAQTGIDSAIRQPAPAPTGNCTAPVADPAVAVAELGGTYQTSVCFRGQSLTPGSSIGRAPTYNYEVSSTGTTGQRDARARLVQGYAVTGATGR
ncbi:MAG: pilus assembly PilX N-terminal domain-containing protein [Gammaproteobacteria bacterium]